MPFSEYQMPIIEECIVPQKIFEITSVIGYCLRIRSCSWIKKMGWKRSYWCKLFDKWTSKFVIETTKSRNWPSKIDLQDARKKREGGVGGWLYWCNYSWDSLLLFFFWPYTNPVSWIRNEECEKGKQGMCSPQVRVNIRMQIYNIGL